KQVVERRTDVALGQKRTWQVIRSTRRQWRGAAAGWSRGWMRPHGFRRGNKEAKKYKRVRGLPPTPPHPFRNLNEAKNRWGLGHDPFFQPVQPLVDTVGHFSVAFSSFVNRASNSTDCSTRA